jgi:DNA-binding response OmpR family regulator
MNIVPIGDCLTKRIAQVPSVLLISDNPMSCELVSSILRHDEIIVAHADTVEDSMLVANAIFPHLILADWDTEGVEGRKTVVELKRRTPSLAHLPSILMTDREISRVTRLELSRQGFRWILQKPVVTTSLPTLVRRTISESGQGRRSNRFAVLVSEGQTASGAMFEAIN